MHLIDDPKWKSVTSGVRTIVPKDVKYYPAITWHELLFHLEVVPTQTLHRYRIKTLEDK